MGGREETENRQRNLLCYDEGDVKRSSDRRRRGGTAAALHSGGGTNNNDCGDVG